MIFGEGPIIKNIAGDLNKLFLQGTRAGQPITNVEGDAAADQGTADLLAAMDPVIQEVAVGMSGEDAQQYTVSGTPPLAITKSLGKALTSWSVEVLPYQEGSGDPSPINIRTIHGTNKINWFVEASYDPSATPKAVITLDQTIYAGTVSDTGGEIRMIEKIFTVTDSIRMLNTPQYVGANSTHFYIPAISPLISTTVSGSMCNMAIGGTCNAQNETNDNRFSRDGNSIFHFQFSNTVLGIDAEDDVNTRISKISTWITNADLRIVYALQTPIQFSITAPDIQTPSGDAAAWATAEDGTVDGMEVTYVGKA